MRWVVRIKREDDGSESDGIRIERSRVKDAAGLGLTLENSKRIMTLLQKRVLTDQLRERCRSSRRCNVCARTRAIKCCRQRVIDTIFGRLRSFDDQITIFHLARDANLHVVDRQGKASWLADVLKRAWNLNAEDLFHDSATKSERVNQ
jgi:hypothetical protein